MKHPILKVFLGAAFVSIHTITWAQHTHTDDVTIDGALCVGLDCAETEDFGSDDQRYKQNNLRIHFDDTSISGAFPKNDWRIIINDDNNGGDEYFSVQDATANKIVFRLDAGAPVDALRVHDDGDVTMTEKLGVGASNPVLSAHLKGGDSPGVRIEQDLSEGWTAQTWDLAGNEENFFIRDITHSSEKPFRIKPNSPEDALYIQPTQILLNGGMDDLNLVIHADTMSNLLFTDGEKAMIGIGHNLPEERLDVNGNIKATGFILPTDAADGSVLTSNSLGIATWQPLEQPTIIQDEDQDTKIQIEESADEDYIRFDVAGMEAMVIDNQGNIGIGTNEPDHALHIVGDLGMTGGVYGVSDARIKKNVETIDHAMDIIRAMEGKTYQFKTEEFADLKLPEHQQFGLIAQEVEAVFSDLVTQRLAVTHDQNGEEMVLKGVNYEQIIPILINALKEQDNIIAQQQQNMENLMSAFMENNERLTEMEARLNSLSDKQNVSEVK